VAILGILRLVGLLKGGFFKLGVSEAGALLKNYFGRSSLFGVLFNSVLRIGVGVIFGFGISGNSNN
jgi:hypothetical protein